MSSPLGDSPPAAPGPKPRSRGGAGHVAAGILASRLVGLVRQRVFAHYFGVTDVADAFNQAFRIPNLIQNLFGEGVLSASFIPVYAGLNARGEQEEARRVARAVFALVIATSAVVVTVGILTAPWLTRAIAPGFHGDKFVLTVRLVRILFPGAAVFAISAWALGVLNSHGRFFVAYASAVFWNVAMIATMVVAGQGTNGAELPRLAVWLAWGSLAGAVAQLLVQLPGVLAVVGAVGVRLAALTPDVREVLHNFGPAFVARGVAQISAFVDAMIASLLVHGAVATLNYAQLLYMLPVSLFGMSISAAELPAMSGANATSSDGGAALRRRLETSAARMAFFVVPSAAAFLALGDQLASLLYRTGRFTLDDARWVWWTLGGSAVGLLAATLGRLYSSAFFALRDTRTPLRFAILRVLLTVALGLPFALWLPGVLGLERRWGVAGLTTSAGVAAWVEFVCLRRALSRRIGVVSLAAARVPMLWGCAVVAAALAWTVRLTSGAAPPFLQAAAAVVVFGLAYLALTAMVRIPMAAEFLQRLRRP